MKVGGTGAVPGIEGQRIECIASVGEAASVMAAAQRNGRPWRCGKIKRQTSKELCLSHMRLNHKPCIDCSIPVCQGWISTAEVHGLKLINSRNCPEVEMSGDQPTDAKGEPAWVDFEEFQAAPIPMWVRMNGDKMTMNSALSEYLPRGKVLSIRRLDNQLAIRLVGGPNERTITKESGKRVCVSMRGFKDCGLPRGKFLVKAVSWGWIVDLSTPQG